MGDPIDLDRRADRVEAVLGQLDPSDQAAVVAIRHQEAAVDLNAGSDALGNEVTAETVVPLFCLAKPLVAAAVHDAVQAGELSFEDCLGDLIDVHESLRRATVLELLEHRSGIIGPRGIEAGLLGRAERRLLLAQEPEPVSHPTHYSEVLGFEALGWCLEAALNVDIGILISQDGIWLGQAAAKDLHHSNIWASQIGSPEGDTYPMLFPLSHAAIVDPNPGFGGYCQPDAYLKALGSWLSQPEAPRSSTPAYDEGFGRPIAWTKGVCTSLGSDLYLDSCELIGHLGFMGSSCCAFDPHTGLAVFAVISPMTLDVDASRQLLGRIVSAAITAP